jgi:hypothetical protein
MATINFEEREQLVLSLYKEGKTLKEIAVYLHENNMIFNGGKAGRERTRQILHKAQVKAARKPA